MERGKVVGFACAIVVLVAGCSDSTSTTAPPTSTPVTVSPTTATTTSIHPGAVQYAADVELIHDLWWGERLAFGMGFDDGIAYWVDNNYPPMDCTYEDYIASRYPDGPVAGLAFERAANGPTIRPDDGWVIPGGELEGHVAEGRVYVMSVNTLRIDPRTAPVEPEIRDLHVTIIDGSAHFFIGCPTG